MLVLFYNVAWFMVVVDKCTNSFVYVLALFYLYLGSIYGKHKSYFFLPTRSLTVLYSIALHFVIDPALIMIGGIYLIIFVFKRLQVPPISGGFKFLLIR